ncbi:acyltransferase family protein [Flavobacterium sp. RSB2_4_14]|uniref:acyltransferase family protein n=1 Tax=Flavobacterium sp. RSB2_4_14 TaxID=3447665 RepID=UPI003F3D7D6C
MKIDQLTFTRFIASISIVIFHFGGGSYVFNNVFLSFIFEQANLGVSYFFILSGFVMIIAYYQKESIPFFSYIKNRLARIYPIYFVAIFLLIRISIFSGISLTDVFLNLLMLQAWIPGKALGINFPGWSLSVELFFYLIFPFVFNYFYKKVNFKITAICIIVFWVLSQVLFYFTTQNQVINLFYYTPKDLSYQPFMHLNQFLIGNLLGLYFVNNYKKETKDFTLPIVLILGLLLFVFKFNIGMSYHNGLLAFLFAPLIYFIAISSGKIAAFFSKKICIFLGEISYGIYIYQWPVWSIISDYKLNKYFGIDKVTDFTFSFLLRLSILIFIAAMSYVYFEKPIRNRLKQLI